jgi:hypothetical protein
MHMPQPLLAKSARADSSGGEPTGSQRFRSQKSAGSLPISAPGSFAMLIHLEADPAIAAFAPYTWTSLLKPSWAACFDQLPAYEVRHRSGRYVFVVAKPLHFQSRSHRRAWQAADRLLARSGVWLFLADRRQLQAEPRWSNVLAICRARDEILSGEDRARVLAHLAEVGTASIASCMRLCREASDSYAAVLRMIAAGLVRADLDRELDVAHRLHAVPTRPPDGRAWDRAAFAAG